MKNKALVAPNLDGKTTDQKIQEIYEYALANNRLLNKALQNIGTDNMEPQVAYVIQQAVDNSKGINTYVSQDGFKSYVAQTAKLIDLKVSRDKLISEINISTEEILINASRITLTGYTSINNGFNVDALGKFNANAGTVAGWTFEPNKGMFYGVNDADVSPSLYLGTVDLLKDVAISSSAARKDWRIKIGSSFGVSANGDIYAQNGYFRGKIDAGKIQSGPGDDGPGYIINTMIANGTISSAKLDTVYATQAAFNSLAADVAYIGQLVSGEAVINYLRVLTMRFNGIVAAWGQVNTPTGVKYAMIESA